MQKRIHILILFALLWIAGNKAFAQPDSVAKAVLLLQDANVPAETKVKQALEVIDKAILHPQSAKSAYAWYVRGYIYKDWYKTFESQNKKSKTRIDAVAHMKKALELDTTKEYSPNIRQTLKYLGSTFYNDAGSLLDAANYHLAIENYEKAKECFVLAEPNYNIKAREIDFKNALATVYEKIFRSDIKTNVQYYGMIEELYKQVLVLDTNNWSANYNLAMLYYNYGVDIINNMDVGEDIIVIEQIQEQAKELFKKALPYALKAYALNSKKREVLVCLQGIYFSLYEFEKSDQFKLAIEQLDKEGK